MRQSAYVRWSRHHNDAMRLYAEGHDHAAEREFHAAIAAARHINPPDECLASSLFNLAELYRHEAHGRDAERYYHQALAVAEEFVGGDHPYVAMILRGYARLLRGADRAAEADAVEARAARIWRAPATDEPVRRPVEAS
jgi:hypothetical protein